MSIARDALSQSIGCKTLFATHYHELTSMDKDIYGVKNYNIAVKKARRGYHLPAAHCGRPGG